MNLKSLTALTLAASAAPLVFAGPLAYAVCQTGCNGVAVACYTAAGFTCLVPLVGLIAAPAAAVACSAGLGTCTAACGVVLFAPTP